MKKGEAALEFFLIKKEDTEEDAFLKSRRSARKRYP